MKNFKKLLYTLTPIKFRLPLIFEIRGGAKIKGSEMGTKKMGERKLKGVNWSEEKGL